MEVTATQLRKDLYRLLDRVIETGETIDVARADGRVRIVPVEATEPASRLDRLVRRPDVIVGDPDDLIHVDWSSEWRP